MFALYCRFINGMKDISLVTHNLGSCDILTAVNEVSQDLLNRSVLAVGSHLHPFPSSVQHSIMGSDTAA